MSRKNAGFTIVEMMMVLVVIGILITSLTSSYVGYQKRARDTERVSDLSHVGKAVNTYFQDFEIYPDSDVGCLSGSLLAKYAASSVLVDPLSSNDNGCGKNGRYGYGMSTGLTIPSNQYVLIAKMEIPESGNYGGSLDGMTGSLTQAGYTSTRNISKGAGMYMLLSK